MGLQSKLDYIIVMFFIICMETIIEAKTTLKRMYEQGKKVRYNMEILKQQCELFLVQTTLFQTTVYLAYMYNNMLSYPNGVV